MGWRRGRKGLFPYSEVNKTLENEYKFNINIMVRLFIKEATTYYKFSYRNVCKSNFMWSKRTMHRTVKTEHLYSELSIETYIV